MVTIESGIDFLAFLTIISQLFLILYISNVTLLKKSSFKFFPKFFEYVENKTLFFAFLISLTATLGSLYLSEILKFTPCLLCWWQRVFMYPQAILFFVAMKKKDKKIFSYAFFLSIIGGLIALYHYVVQINPDISIACSTVGYSASCSETFVTTLGYITIPMMAFTAFVLILSLAIFNLRKH